MVSGVETDQRRGRLRQKGCIARRPLTMEGSGRGDRLVAGQERNHARSTRDQVQSLRSAVLEGEGETAPALETLRQAGYSEDQILEISIAAALGAGLGWLSRGLRAMRPETSADDEISGRDS